MCLRQVTRTMKSTNMRRPKPTPITKVITKADITDNKHLEDFPKEANGKS